MRKRSLPPHVLLLPRPLLLRLGLVVGREGGREGGGEGGGVFPVPPFAVGVRGGRGRGGGGGGGGGRGGGGGGGGGLVVVGFVLFGVA